MCTIMSRVADQGPYDFLPHLPGSACWPCQFSRRGGPAHVRRAVKQADACHSACDPGDGAAQWVDAETTRTKPSAKPFSTSRRTAILASFANFRKP